MYLLQSIIEDLKEDKKMVFEVKDDGYFFSSSVYYPNNQSLVSQNVYVSRDGNITKTEVLDKDGNVQIVMNFTKIEFGKKFDDNYFELNQLLKMNQKSTDGNNNSNNTDNNTDNNSDNNSNNTANNTDNNSDNNSNNTANNSDNNSNNNSDNNSANTNNNSNGDEVKSSDENSSEVKSTGLDVEVVYPMYLPNNTYLVSQEKVDTKNGERLILTFDGESSFVLVEEVSRGGDDDVVVPVNGEFDFFADVIGVISGRSLSWHSNGVDYYMASDVIEVSELIDIARSISVLPVSK